MEVRPATHPSAATLEAFCLGKLADSTLADTVFQHVETCAECQEKVVVLSGDSFLRGLRDARQQNDVPIPTRAVSDISRAMKAAEHISTTPPLVPDLPDELRDHSQFEVMRELGRGGMGVVYLARNKLMDRLEVLKVVNKTLLDRPGMLERFLREIRSAAKLNHPNIVTAYNAMQLGELLVFAMEYVPGEDLAHVVKSYGGPLPVLNACYYVQQVLLGLQHAYEKGMVHRDIKPQNLILAKQGKKQVVKILDFGLAKARSEKGADHDLTGAGKMLGTPDYIAPEQSLDAASADIRADIYSLGCTFYYLLAGHAPFKGRSLFEILQAHQSQVARPLHQERADVPAELAAVVAKMLAKEPARRYQTPIEVAQALLPFIKGGDKGPSTATRPASDSRNKQPTGGPGRQETLAEGPVTVGEVQKSPKPPARVSARPAPTWRRWVIVSGVLVAGVLAGAVGLWACGVIGGRTKDEAAVSVHVPPDAERQGAGTNAAERMPATRTGPSQSGAFKSLFNGKDLTGWRLDGGDAKAWNVANGELVAWGQDAKSRSFLVTDQIFADFRLRLEFNLSRGARGGIGLRALLGEKLPYNGQLLVDHPRLMLIDGRDNEETGTMQWVLNTTFVAPSQAAEQNPPGAWNQLEIELRGRTVHAWVNRKPIVDTSLADGAHLSDGAFPALVRARGRVGIQRFAGAVRYRNIEIQELPRSAGQIQQPAGQYVSLSPEKDWGKWRIVDGMLEQTSQSENVWISFGDVTWRDYDYSVEFLRVKDNDQCCLLVLNDPEKKQGCLFGLSSFTNTEHTLEAWGNGKPTKMYARKKAGLPAGVWQRARVSVRNGQVQCFLNDQRWFDNKMETHATGRVGLRTWNSVYRFRNIKVTDPSGKVLLEGLPDLTSK
jgi:serine/threonine protein kinase